MKSGVYISHDSNRIFDVKLHRLTGKLYYFVYIEENEAMVINANSFKSDTSYLAISLRKSLYKGRL